MARTGTKQEAVGIRKTGTRESEGSGPSSRPGVLPAVRAGDEESGLREEGPHLASHVHRPRAGKVPAGHEGEVDGLRSQFRPDPSKRFAQKPPHAVPRHRIADSFSRHERRAHRAFALVPPEEVDPEVGASRHLSAAEEPVDIGRLAYPLGPWQPLANRTLWHRSPALWGQTLPPFRPPAGEHASSAAGLHPLPEPVGSFLLDVARLKRALHAVFPRSLWFPRPHGPHDGFFRGDAQPRSVGTTRDCVKGNHAAREGSVPGPGGKSVHRKGRAHKAMPRKTLRSRRARKKSKKSIEPPRKRVLRCPRFGRSRRSRPGCGSKVRSALDLMHPCFDFRPGTPPDGENPAAIRGRFVLNLFYLKDMGVCPRVWITRGILVPAPDPSTVLVDKGVCFGGLLRS